MTSQSGDGSLVRSPAFTYVLLTFGFSWTVWGLGIPATDGGVRTLVVLLGAWGPTLAAVGLTARREGWTGVRRLLGRLVAWRVGITWYAVAVLSVPASVVVAVAIATSGGLPDVTMPGGIGLVFLPVVFLVNVFVGGPLAEEVGWRGFAFPSLVDRLGSTGAALAVGVLWAAWHLPFYVLPGGVGVVAGIPLWAFVPLLVAWSVVFSWAVDRANGSLLVAVLFHASVNTTLGTVAGIDPARTHVLIALVAVQTVVALAVVLLAGPNWPVYTDREATSRRLARD